MREGFLHSIAVFIGFVFVFALVLYVWKVILFDLTARRHSCREFHNMAYTEWHFAEVSFKEIAFNAKPQNQSVVYALNWIKFYSNKTQFETKIFILNCLQTGKPTPEKQSEKLKN